MDDKNDAEITFDDFTLPGFRFHPTDEELVGFYLKMKLQHQSLPIELIKQVDIYKYDPWDLPKLASTGERESYFYCPRDRKYKNSSRPNRVTGSGFWKATGTDRPIYSSDGNKCIGLKKSLVFYRGRAAKGMKTDWMMHEFRLPSNTDRATPSQKFLDKKFSANDSWAICRIFKKTNSTAQRALSHAWAASLSETTSPDALIHTSHHTENISSTTEIWSSIQFPSNNQSQPTDFSALNIPTYKTYTTTANKPPDFATSNGDYFPGNFSFSPSENISYPNHKRTTLDITSILSNLSPASITGVTKDSESVNFEGQQQLCNGFSISSSAIMQAETSVEDEEGGLEKNLTKNIAHNPLENIQSMRFPFSLPYDVQDSWKSYLPWDSPSYPS